MAEAVAEKTPSHVVLFATHDESNKDYHHPVIIDLAEGMPEGEDLTTESGALVGVNNILNQLKKVTSPNTVTRLTCGGTANVEGIRVSDKEPKPGTTPRIASILGTEDIPVHPILRLVVQGVARNSKALATGVWQAAPGVTQTGVWAGNTALNQYRANVKTLGDFVKQAIGDLEKGTPKYNERLTAVQAQVAPIIEFAKQSIPAIIEGAKKWKAGHPDGELPQDVLDLMD